VFSLLGLHRTKIGKRHKTERKLQSHYVIDDDLVLGVLASCHGGLEFPMFTRQNV
jgi:hypothetical protein